MIFINLLILLTVWCYAILNVRIVSDIVSLCDSIETSARADVCVCVLYFCKEAHKWRALHGGWLRHAVVNLSPSPSSPPLPCWSIRRRSRGRTPSVLETMLLLLQEADIALSPQPRTSALRNSRVTSCEVRLRILYPSQSTYWEYFWSVNIYSHKSVY